MKSENEIREKIEGLQTMQRRAQKNYDFSTAELIALQIDMLLWIIDDKSGLPPLDENPTYACYINIER